MQRVLPIAVAVLIALLGFGSAGVVNQVGVRWALSLPEGGELEPLPGLDAEGGEPQLAEVGDNTPKVVVRKPRSYYVDGILARNLFNSASIGKTDAVVDEGDAASDLKVELLATIVAIPARSSSALVMVDTEKRARVVGVGGQLGNAEVTAIESTRIEIKRLDGKVEYISIKTTKNETGTKAGPATTTAVGEDGIIQHSETSFTVPRETIAKYTTDLAGLSKLGRAIPHRGPDGNIDGYRISGVRRGTVGEQLGIRNGDVFHGVNGESLASVQEAMGAYQSLQTAGAVKFEITRRGQKMTMEYTIK